MPTQPQTISFADLPPLGAPLDVGEFGGVITRQDGVHCAVVRLSQIATDLTQKKAMAAAKKLGAELPTKAVGALITTNLKVEPGAYWTSEEYTASYAWLFHSLGSTNYNLKSASLSALFVRRS